MCFLFGDFTLLVYSSVQTLLEKLAWPDDVLANCVIWNNEKLTKNAVLTKNCLSWASISLKISLSIIGKKEAEKKKKQNPNIRAPDSKPKSIKSMFAAAAIKSKPKKSEVSIEHKWIVQWSYKIYFIWCIYLLFCDNVHICLKLINTVNLFLFPERC